MRALLALLAAAACLLAVSPGASAAAPCTPHWVGSWAASPNDGSLLQPFADQTLRMIVAPHLAGSTLRVHLSNRFGLLPVTLGPVTIGLMVTVLDAWTVPMAVSTTGTSADFATATVTGIG